MMSHRLVVVVQSAVPVACTVPVAPASPPAVVLNDVNLCCYNDYAVGDDSLVVVGNCCDDDGSQQVLLVAV